MRQRLPDGRVQRAVTSDLAISVLGPFELKRGRTTVSAGGPTQRAALAILALRAGQPVGVDEMVAGIWGESDEPLSGSGSIHVHVSRIRSLLKRGSAQPLVTVPGGYRLQTDDILVDAVEFERLLGEGRERLTAGEARRAAENLDEALALWRGPALMDLRNFPFADRLAGRLNELRVDAAEERIAARMAVGEERALLPQLQALIADHPYRERLHAQLMVALYRAGQQAAALDAYQAARSRLEMDLGVGPGPELERLHRAILEQDADLTAPPPQPEGHAPPRVSGLTQPRRVPAAPLLIGRDELLDELEQLSGDHRLLTLTGPGGTGKTALALSLLHRLAPRFADGAAFVDLAPVARPDQVASAIATGLGVSQAGAGLSERLVGVLADRQLVVVLDNLEHLLESTPNLAPLVDATRGLFIATSRIALNLRAEYVVLVPPLRVPHDDASANRSQEPAVQLFIEAATAAGGEVGGQPEDLAAVARICRAVDGLPLAIEIAAAQTRTETVTEIADHLGDRLVGLRGRAHDAPARQRTMEAAIGWSVDLLGAEQRLAFERLAVFAGAFAASGAAAILGSDHPRTIELLADLLDASLLSRQPSIGGHAQFRMLEPIRSVARAIGQPAEVGAAAERHGAFIRQEIERLCPASSGIQRPEDLDQLRAEHNDLVVALGHLARVAPDARVDLIVQLQDYWSWTGREGVALALVSDDLERGTLSDRATCAALALRAEYRIIVGQVHEAQTDIDRALVLAERVALPALSARVRMIEARLSATILDIPAAQATAAAAIAEARRAGDPRLLAEGLAEAATWQIPPASSMLVGQWLEEGLQIARSGQMAHVETTLLAHALRYYSESEHNLEMAAEYGRLALELAQRFGSLEREAVFADDLATVRARAGASSEETRAILLSALRTRDRIGHRLESVYLLGSIGVLEAAAGRWQNAVTLLRSVLGIAEAMGAGLFESERAALRAAEKELAATTAAGTGDAAEHLTFREAVQFAFKVSRVGPDPRVRDRVHRGR